MVKDFMKGRVIISRADNINDTFEAWSKPKTSLKLKGIMPVTHLDEKTLYFLKDSELKAFNKDDYVGELIDQECWGFAKGWISDISHLREKKGYNLFTIAGGTTLLIPSEKVGSFKGEFFMTKMQVPSMYYSWMDYTESGFVGEPIIGERTRVLKVHFSKQNMVPSVDSIKLIRSSYPLEELAGLCWLEQKFLQNNKFNPEGSLFFKTDEYYGHINTQTDKTLLGKPVVYFKIDKIKTDFNNKIRVEATALHGGYFKMKYEQFFR